MVGSSSGTTGVPKTFLMSHEQFRRVVDMTARSLEWQAGDRYVALHGAIVFWGCEECRGVLWLGGTVVIQRTKNQIEFIEFVNRHRITLVSLTPPYLKALIHAARNTTCAFPTVRSMIVASAPTEPSRPATPQWGERRWLPIGP